LAVKKRSLFFFREQRVKKYHPTQKKVSDGVWVIILFEIEYKKLREQDLNLRPSGYEPDELPDCSIPRYQLYYMLMLWICQIVLEEWK
jgi:hypothetical protein